MFEISPTSEMLARAIDVCALRQAVHSANIANAGAEGYKRLEVRFDELTMREEVLSGATRPERTSEPTGVATADVVATHDAVKLDEEMAAMAQNAMRYQMLMGLYERSLGSLRMAIREGREG